MKKSVLLTGLLTLAGGFLSTDALAARSVETVSKAQFGSQWAFVKEEVQLQCTKDQALFVINASTLAQYPLDEKANSLVKAKKMAALPLETILLYDPDHPGQKMSVTPFIEHARQLCQ